MPDETAELQPETRPSFPTAARMAGLVWMILGGLAALGSCGAAASPVFLQIGKPGNAAPVQISPATAVATWIGVMVGGLFFVLGRRIMNGTAKNLVIGSAVSLLIGLLYSWSAVYILLILKDPPPAIEATGGVAAGIGGFGLFAGGLALAGRSQYLKWRQWQTDPDKSPRPKRPPANNSNSPGRFPRKTA
ncbi:hypothetical protein [Zavarzinella formosa]|uniref:hypothetical protein n=1 Tax=Zavarzinella formosa TaxID=360055 RepID=UPI0002DAE3AC|nr:hypothetical protein [Zavarzinella formosa]